MMQCHANYLLYSITNGFTVLLVCVSPHNRTKQRWYATKKKKKKNTLSLRPKSFFTHIVHFLLNNMYAYVLIYYVRLEARLFLEKLTQGKNMSIAPWLTSHHSTISLREDNAARFSLLGDKSSLILKMCFSIIETVKQVLVNHFPWCYNGSSKNRYWNDNIRIRKMLTILLSSFFVLSDLPFSFLKKRHFLLPKKIIADLK